MKKRKESLRLIGEFLNDIGLALIAAGFFTPMIKDLDLVDWAALFWVFMGLFCHLISHNVMRYRCEIGS